LLASRYLYNKHEAIPLRTLLSSKTPLCIRQAVLYTLQY